MVRLLYEATHSVPGPPPPGSHEAGEEWDPQNQAQVMQSVTVEPDVLVEAVCTWPGQPLQSGPVSSPALLDPGSSLIAP